MAKPQYKDIPSAWNGTELKGLKKTVIFLKHFSQGKHQLTFIPYQGVKLTTKWRFLDSDDIKLIVNGQIKKNPDQI